MKNAVIRSKASTTFIVGRDAVIASASEPHAAVLLNVPRRRLVPVDPDLSMAGVMATVAAVALPWAVTATVMPQLSLPIMLAVAAGIVVVLSVSVWVLLPKSRSPKDMFDLGRAEVFDWADTAEIVESIDQARRVIALVRDREEVSLPEWINSVARPPRRRPSAAAAAEASGAAAETAEGRDSRPMVAVRGVDDRPTDTFPAVDESADDPGKGDADDSGKGDADDSGDKSTA